MLPTIATGNVGSALAGEYEVANSVRLNISDTPYLNRTNGTATNNDKYTFSLWTKRASISSTFQFLLEGWTGNADTTCGILRFRSDDRLDFMGYNTVYRRTTRVFRDISAWYNIIVAVDTTQSTASDRIKMYINGVEETEFDTNNNPSQNANTGINNNSANLNLFRRYLGSVNDLHFGGYCTEYCFIDGQQLDQTSFGEFDEDSGIWKPIDVTGLTFGTNGFYLDFEDSSALGNDVSGNNNDFTVNNLTSIDQNEDTCTNNWCTQNPLSYRSGQTVPTYSEGNLKVVFAASVNTFSYGTLGVQAGKWYWGVKVTFGSNVYTGIGFASAATNTDINGYLLRQTGQKYDTSGSASSYASALSTGDTVMVAFDADNGTLWFGVNGTWSNSATQTEIENGTTSNSAFSSIDMSSIWLPLSKGGTSSNSNIQANFGNPIYSISSGNSDANGHGNFEYTVPSGYYALNTSNLNTYG